jgi:hypothetical protein
VGVSQGDEGVHGFGPDQGNLPKKRQIHRQTGQQEGKTVKSGTGGPVHAYVKQAIGNIINQIFLTPRVRESKKKM